MTPKQKLIYEAIRFANWAAGEGLCPAAGGDAMEPAEFLFEYSCATGDEEWETFAERIAALSEQLPPSNANREST